MAALAAGAAPASAQASFGIASASVTPASTQAGRHADLSTDIVFNQDGTGTPEGSLRDLVIELPPGLIGNPQGVPTCSQSDFFSNACPAATQVGSGQFDLLFLGNPAPSPAAVYNLQARPDEPARLGITVKLFGVLPLPVQVLTFGVRTGDDYGLTTTAEATARQFPIQGIHLTLWGVPADHGTGASRVPFMTNPTSCAGGLHAVVRADSYEAPGTFAAVTVPVATPTGCGSVPFSPSIKTLTSSRVVDSAGAFSVDIVVPQSQDPDGLASANLKTATVQLPEGVSINPGLAHDLTACTDGAFGLHDDQAAQCPAGSKIGKVGIATPLLATPIPGDIYVGQPVAGNPFRLFVYAEGSGVKVKLEGTVNPDPKTGRLTAVFADNPQIPFSDFHLEFQGGPQAVLAMPTTCGPNTTVASLAPWSGQAAVGATDMFLTFGDASGGPCPLPQPFSPSFTAGVTNAGAGQDTGFTMKFGRADGQQTIKSLEASLPAGVLGRLSSIPECPKAVVDAFAAGAPGAAPCSDASLVGSTVVSAGSGDAPLNIEGQVWLTEPFSPGQIAGLAIFVPAQAGPYYLGNVVVRAGLYVKPDASIDVLSDPLPSILEGIPLRIKQVIVNMDRPGFMFNPTNCRAQQVSATITSAGGVDAPVSVPFGVHDCAALPFSPHMDVGTAAPRNAGGPTGLDVNLHQGGGQANLKKVQLTLPKGIGARLEGPVQTPCEIADWYKGQCTDASKVGHATATTPILGFPLDGDVHFVKNPAGGLPKLGIVLTGGPVTIPLLGDVELSGGRLRTTIAGIPDAPISRFELVLDAGRNAALSAGELCSGRQTADAELTGQNGKVLAESIRVDVLGCDGSTRARAKSKRHHRARGHGRRHARTRRQG